MAIARQLLLAELGQAEVSLARAALYLALEEYPDLDPEEYLNALDTMAEEVQERLPAYPLKKIQALNDYLYRDLGFGGNESDYYDPRNSYLNEVIDRRLGIPITLALVYLEIAQRVGFPMVGVGMPGHFLLRPNLAGTEYEEMELYVDAFHQGEVLFVEDCAQRFTQIYGKLRDFDSAFLQPVSPRFFLARMLTNLKAIYLRQGDQTRALAQVERLLLLLPNAPLELRDRGILYYQAGRYEEAIHDLELYLELAPNEESSTVIQELLGRLRKI